MAASTVLQLLVLAVSGHIIFLHHVQVVSGLHVEIFPTVINELITDVVSVKCFANDSPYWTESVLVIELGKKDEHPLAILRKTKLQLGAGLKHNMIADGKINEVNITQSFLRIKIKNPELKDAGIYVCRMFYMDGYGDLKEGKADANLTFDNNNDNVVLVHLLKKVSDLEKTADTQDKLLKKHDAQTKVLEKKLKDQQNNTKVLENTLTQQKEELKDQQDNTNVLKKQLKNQQDKTNALGKELKEQQDKTKALEKTVVQQEKQLEDQRTNETVTIAFSYAYNHDHMLVQGQPVLFTDKIMSIGDAYDPKTGVFTAPRDGLYVFHLLVATDRSDDNIEIHLKANGKVLAGLWVRDIGDNDQGSVSSVTSLKAGDQVRPVVISFSATNNNAWGEEYSTFTGYLIKSL